MYKKLIFVLLATAGLSHGASYIFTNNTGTPANVSTITSAAGVGFSAGTAGVASVGYFSISDTAIQNIDSGASLVSSFVALNPTPGTNGDGSANFVNPTALGFRGFFTETAGARTIDGSAFEDKNMYILVGNGTTFANSTEFLVLKSTVTFAAGDDDVLPNKTIIFTDANTSVILGTLGGNVKSANTDNTINVSWATIAVPEPSTAFLGLLGALGLLRRRR